MSRTTDKYRRLLAGLLLAAAVLLAAPAFAQIPALPSLPSLPSLPAAPAPAPAPATAAQQPVGPPAPPADALGRDTPQRMVQGFLKAVGAEDYVLASQYLDLSKLPKAKQKTDGPVLAKSLQTLLDQNGWVAANSKLSDKPEGDATDDLPPLTDRVGKIKTKDDTVDLIVERRDDADAGPIWKFSSDTISHIPRLEEGMTIGLLDRLLPAFLIDTKLSGVPVGHWMFAAAIAPFSYMAAWLLFFIVTTLIRLVFRRMRAGNGKHVLDVIVPPIRFYMAVVLFVFSTRGVGLSIVARENLSLFAEVLAWLSLAWLLWSAIDVFTETMQSRMTQTKHRNALSAIVFFRRTARFVVAAVAIAVAMDRMGLNVTAGVAALGLGGVALAFGAQKTLENLVASLILIIEQPVRIGDFCKVGETLGTVEDIGMRSTRLLTLNRTMVTIPNATVATQTIENYALRDRYLFRPTIGLRYETESKHLRSVLESLRSLMKAHPRVDTETCRVRLVELGKDSLNVEIFAHVFAPDYNSFLEAQEDIYLKIIDIVNASHTGFAFPSQTVYMGRDTGITVPDEDDKAA